MINESMSFNRGYPFTIGQALVQLLCEYNRGREIDQG